MKIYVYCILYYRPSLTVLSYITINIYISLKFCFFFILLKSLNKAQFQILLTFYVDFTRICFLFYGKYSDLSPWTSNSSRQTRPLPVCSQEPYRKALVPLHSTDRELPDSSPQVSDSSQADSIIIRVVLTAYRKSILRIPAMFPIRRYYT